MFTDAQLKPYLNLVLCGSNAQLKSSAAELILGLEEHQDPSPLISPVCVKRDAFKHGHDVTVVILPSLEKTQVSEEEALRETLQCLTLCGSRVHAFLLVIQGPLSEEDKEEFRNIQHFFGEEAESHFQVVVMGEAVPLAQIIMDATGEPQDIHISERSYHNLAHASEVEQLLEQVEKIGEENGNVCYTMDMYVAAQIRHQMKYLDELINMRISVESLEIQNKELQRTEQGNYNNVIFSIGK